VKLTIIIPVYKVEATLERCIESVVNQDFNDYELILVDDGSPDGCPAICDKWAIKDQRIQVIHKKNGGLSDARNAGLDIAQGDYITFIDSDDFIDTQTYTPLINYLENHPETDILEYPAILFYQSEQQQDLRFPNQTVYHDMEDYWYQEKAYQHSYAWNKLYRKSLFDEARFPTGVVFEDICTLHKLLEKTQVLATINQGCYYYCFNPEGITATADGPALRMHLLHHISILNNSQRRDADFHVYYFQVLNIQIDTYIATGDLPMLPDFKLNPSYFEGSAKLKVILFNILGVKKLCKLISFFKRL
jgi:glycosyltransferase involved in cell wall biosynthesis